MSPTQDFNLMKPLNPGLRAHGVYGHHVFAAQARRHDKASEVAGGYAKTPAHLSADASALYSRNLFNFLSAFWDKDAGRPVLDAEIGDAVRLTQGGKVVNERLLG